MHIHITTLINHCSPGVAVATIATVVAVALAAVGGSALMAASAAVTLRRATAPAERVKAAAETVAGVAHGADATDLGQAVDALDASGLGEVFALSSSDSD